MNPDPPVGKEPADGQRARRPVVGAGEVHVALQLAEVGQDPVPPPAVGAHGLPGVIIGRRAAGRDLAVDGRPAADQPGLFVRDGAGVVGSGGVAGVRRPSAP